MCIKYFSPICSQHPKSSAEISWSFEFYLTRLSYYFPSLVRDEMVSFFCREAKAHLIFFSQLDSVLDWSVPDLYFLLLSFWILLHEAVPPSSEAIGIGGFCFPQAWVISWFLPFWLSSILVLRIIIRNGWSASARYRPSQSRRQDNCSSQAVVKTIVLLAKIAISQSTLMIHIFLESRFLSLAFLKYALFSVF